jgi:DNA-binding response OmpR family regulator
MTKLLLIDDDVDMVDMVRDYLEPEGFLVDAALDGGHGLQLALEGRYALVVLDVMLPVLPGLDVLRRIRAASDVPVLMLTARGEAVDRIIGLRIGADDYLPKPFVPQELVARIQAILRRTRATSAAVNEPKGDVTRVGDLQVSSAGRLVLKNREPVELTSAEFDVLYELVSAVGRVVPREHLYLKVLGRALAAHDRSLDNHVSSLRRKLGTHRNGTDRIRAIRNVGYIYCLPVEDTRP